MMHDLGNGKLLESIDKNHPVPGLPFVLGEFSLTELLQAFDLGLDAATKSPETGYDIMNINCSDFPISLVTYLEVPITKELVGFVVDGLLNGGDGKTVQAVHAEDVDDETLLEQFSDMYVTQLLGHSIDSNSNSNTAMIAANSTTFASFDESFPLARIPVVPDQALGDKCGNITYQLETYSEYDHIFLVAEPADIDNVNDCPTLMMHDLGEGKLLESIDEPVPGLPFSVGEFSLEQILQAFGLSLDIRTMAPETGFDITQDLCSRCPMCLLELLGVPITDELVDFAVDGILNGGDGKIVGLLRSHPDFDILFPDTDANDETLLKQLKDIVLSIDLGQCTGGLN
ncbi:MAG: hypothetical protein SGARI_003736 [Bacillariaceae sp.]